MKTTPVCIYLRMSSDQQELSLDKQREILQAYCKAKGYAIVAEYVDEGKSASKQLHKRKEFLRMVDDAATAKWAGIVCLNSSRFARLDSLKGAGPKQKLREAGKWYETPEGGRIDWNSFQGRITDSINAEVDNKYSLDLSHNTVDGRENLVRQLGYWPHGTIPFGYDREYYEAGKLVHKQKRNAPVRKARQWHLKLSVNEKEAKVVRWLFEEFVNKDTSLRQLAQHMTNKGYDTQRGSKAWKGTGLAELFRNPAYVGTISSKFGKRNNKEVHNRIEKVEKQDGCPAIVPLALWEAANKKLEKHKEHKPQPMRAGFVSGILYCGHCGYALEKKQKKNRDGTTTVRYTCSSGNRRRHLGCAQWGAREDEVLPILVNTLKQELDGKLDGLKSKPRQQEQSEAKALQAKAAKLEAQVKQAGARFLEAGEDLADVLLPKLQAMKQELAEVRQQISEAGSSSKEGLGTVAQWWEETKGKLLIVQGFGSKGGKLVGPGNVGMDETRPSSKPSIFTTAEDFRGLLHKLETRLTLHWKPAGSNGRYFKLDHGKLTASIGENVLRACSSRCSRVRSRDRD